MSVIDKFIFNSHVWLCFLTDYNIAAANANYAFKTLILIKFM